MSQKMSKSKVWEASSILVILALLLALVTALMTPGPAAAAATWYVDGTLGTDDGIHGTGPGTNAFKTIQYSISDSRVFNSDTIIVAAGTYNEDIEINKGLTIQSSTGAANTIIRGSGDGSSYYMIRIFHRDVTFDGFTVTNPIYDGGADASGILVGDYSGVSVNNIRILNNIIEEVRNGNGVTPSGYGATGINIGHGAPSNILISGNIIQNIHNPDGSSLDHTCGINVWDNGTGILISNNRISDIKFNGIFLQYANSVKVISNTITQCQVGVKIDPDTGVSGVTIDHNIIVGNSAYGVENQDPTIVINAQNNWWGCNDGPGAVGLGSGDKVSNYVTYGPWLVLNLCANTPSIPADGVSTSSIIAYLTNNSDGKNTSALGHIPDGTQIIFTTDKGSIGSPTTKTTTNGIATAVFTSTASPSIAILSARAPTYYTCATASASVNMYTPQPPGRGLSSCDWVEYGNNPVFGQWLGGPKAYYPKVIYDVNQFSGHGDSHYYKMWFQSSNGIGYAYSNDGVLWTAGTNPLSALVAGASHPLVKYDPNGFGLGVYYKIWYWTGIMDYTINNLHYAESGDGITWTNDQPLTQDVNYPLVTGNSGPDWNAGSYGPCDLIYNSSGSASLDDYDIWNNKYVMYYMGTTGGNEFIGLSYSANGTHWKRLGCTPILSPCTLANDPSACWDYYAVGYCSVINVSGSWQMWYGGGEGTNRGIGYATSPDGIVWTKNPGNPIFHISDSIPWSDNRTYTPWVLYDAANFGKPGNACPYKMWFSGKNTATEKYSIGYASTTPVFAPIGGGGGGGDLPAAVLACPLGLVADIQGTITIASMTGKGVLCETCIAKDASGKYVLELDKDTQITLPDNAVPLLLTFRESSTPPPAPENTTIVGPSYEISAYSTSYATVPLPVTISPPAKLTLTYDPEKLPKNATEVYIADYDATKGWLALSPVPGVVAELGKVQGLASHFSPIAVLARLAEPTPAKFEVSNLAVSPHQVMANQEVTINIKVANTGEKSGDYSLQLKVDGILKSSKQVTVPGGASQVVNFTTTGYTAGKHKVEIAGLSGEFEIIGVSQPASTNLWFVVGGVAILLLMAVVLFALRR